jgi:hypothetical protein
MIVNLPNGIPSTRSLGNALRLLGVPLRTFRTLQAEVGVAPCKIDDDVEVFDDDDVAKLKERLADKQRKGSK